MMWLDSTIATDAILAYSTYRPVTDIALFPGATTDLLDDPLILDSPYLLDLGGVPTTLLWLDAARAPTTISTLLIIGV
jgi:hypothetical protein